MAWKIRLFSVRKFLRRRRLPGANQPRPELDGTVPASRLFVDATRAVQACPSVAEAKSEETRCSNCGSVSPSSPSGPSKDSVIAIDSLIHATAVEASQAALPISDVTEPSCSPTTFISTQLFNKSKPLPPLPTDPRRETEPIPAASTHLPPSSLLVGPASPPLPSCPDSDSYELYNYRHEYAATVAPSLSYPDTELERGSVSMSPTSCAPGLLSDRDSNGSHKCKALVSDMHQYLSSSIMNTPFTKTTSAIVSVPPSRPSSPKQAKFPSSVGCSSDSDELGLNAVTWPPPLHFDSNGNHVVALTSPILPVPTTELKAYSPFDPSGAVCGGLLHPARHWPLTNGIWSLKSKTPADNATWGTDFGVIGSPVLARPLLVPQTNPRHAEVNRTHWATTTEQPMAETHTPQKVSAHWDRMLNHSLVHADDEAQKISPLAWPPQSSTRMTDLDDNSRALGNPPSVNLSGSHDFSLDKSDRLKLNFDYQTPPIWAVHPGPSAPKTPPRPRFSVTHQNYLPSPDLTPPGLKLQLNLKKNLNAGYVLPLENVSTCPDLAEFPTTQTLPEETWTDQWTASNSAWNRGYLADNSGIRNPTRSADLLGNGHVVADSLPSAETVFSQEPYPQRYLSDSGWASRARSSGSELPSHVPFGSVDDPVVPFPESRIGREHRLKTLTESERQPWAEKTIPKRFLGTIGDHLKSTPETADAAPPPLRTWNAGPLRVSAEKLVGAGSFGRVYRVQQPRGQVYALKKIDLRKIDENELPCLAREVKLMFSLRNADQTLPGYDCIMKFPDLVNFVFLDSNGYLNIYSDYYPGTLLNYRWIIRKDQRALLFVISEITQGLLYLHSIGIVHVDIKPENIFVADQTQRCVIGDIGGGVHAPGEILPGQCGVPATLGTRTPGFCAPEVHPKSERYDCRADFWSLGATIYATIVPWGIKVPKCDKTGSCSAYMDYDRMGMRRKTMRWKMVRSGCPKQVRTMVLNMCQRDPKNRLSALEIQDMLKNESCWDIAEQPSPLLYYEPYPCVINDVSDRPSSMSSRRLKHKISTLKLVLSEQNALHAIIDTI